MGKTPLSLHELIKKAYTSYYESAFSINNDKIASERLSLLNEDGTTSREPYLEVVDKYPAGFTFDLNEGGFYVIEKFENKLIVRHKFNNFHFFSKNILSRRE